MNTSVNKFPEEFVRFRDVLALKFEEGLFDQELGGWPEALEAWDTSLDKSTQKETGLYILLTILEVYTYKLDYGKLEWDFKTKCMIKHKPKDRNLALQLSERLLREIPNVAPLQIDDEKMFPLARLEEMISIQLDQYDLAWRKGGAFSSLFGSYYSRYLDSPNLSDLNHAIAACEQSLNFSKGLTSDTACLEGYYSELWNMSHV